MKLRVQADAAQLELARQFPATTTGVGLAWARFAPGVYPETTPVTETNDRLYVQSLHAKGLGWKAK